MIFLILLIIAHFMGDFFFQPENWVKSKFKKGIISSGFWKHMGFHFFLLFLVGLIFPQYWLALTAVWFGHLIIDAVKIYTLKYIEDIEFEIWAFLIDQAAHLLLILIVVSQTILLLDMNLYFHPTNLIILMGYLFLSLPASAIIKVLLSPYNQVINIASEKAKKDALLKKSEATEINSSQSLKNAGKYIGIIERLLVFTFILIGQWAAVGFLITAKSVFRFGDLNQGKNRQFTEYVLIGTLLSFGMAIFTALMINFAVAQL